MLAHGIGNDWKGKEVMLRNPIYGRRLAPGAGQFPGHGQVNLGAEGVIGEASIKMPRGFVMHSALGVNGQELRHTMLSLLVPMWAVRSDYPVFISFREFAVDQIVHSHSRQRGLPRLADSIQVNIGFFDHQRGVKGMARRELQSIGLLDPLSRSEEHTSELQSRQYPV